MPEFLRSFERQWEHPATSLQDELLLAILERLEIMSDQLTPIATALTEGLAALNETIAQAETVAEGLAPSPAAISALQVVADGVNTTQKNLQAWISANTPAPAGGPTGGDFSVSPASLTIPLGSTTPVPLSFTGATGAVTATAGLPAGVTFDGTNLVPDGSQLGGNGTVTFEDSSSPALSAAVDLTVQ